MVYILLNAALTIFLGLFTYRVDKKRKTDTFEVSGFAIALLLTAIEAGMFFLTLLCKNLIYDTFTFQFMRLVFCLDGFVFVTLCFTFIKIASKESHTLVKAIKIFAYIFVVYIVYSKFNSIDVSYENGIIIGSEYLFPAEARKFFPWTWFTLYTALFRYALPVVGYIFLLLLQENKANQLEKYQTLFLGEGVVLMWIVNYLVTFIANASPAFSLLFIYSHLFMYLTMYAGFMKTMVPSGKGVLVSLLKVFLSYVFPAVLIGGYAMYFEPVGTVITWKFIPMFIFVGIIAVLFALHLSDTLSSNTRIYTADYEHALEKDLGTIDYAKLEMDQVTAKMFEILKRNIETSSMGVYILNTQNELDVAYSSIGLSNSIKVSNNPMFDTLLNIGKSVVCYNEIEKEHDISGIQEELKRFFGETKSDAAFILNEGHNIFGIITLGKKASGDHYKEYDSNVFVKLYSYFFVFGYYMRNISNKEIISVVNREIRMSSQIITSIQDNIDHIKSPKVDTGYLMVPSHNIGGEFIDMIRLTDSRHLFVVGDLSGKGIAASMNMVILKSIIRTYLAETHDFKELVVKVNTFIRDSLRKGTIFAGLFALIDFNTDTMYYINCGIPALMMYTQVYNNVIEIQGSGHILGFVKDISPYISVKTTKLNRGDIILACTDGLIQSHSLRGEQFGKERVQQALLDNSTYPAQRMAQFTFDSLLRFMSKEMEDDVSILVLKYETSAEYADSEPAEEVVSSTTTETEAESSVENNDDSVSAGDVSFGDASVFTETAVADESIVAETDAPVVEDPVTETVPGNTNAEDKSSEILQTESEQPSETSDDFGLPEGFDLGNIDEMMKMAGL